MGDFLRIMGLSLHMTCMTWYMVTFPLKECINFHFSINLYIYHCVAVQKNESDTK